MPDDSQMAFGLEGQRFVTIGGDCIQLTPQGKLDPHNRDGVVYKFHVTDCKKDRAKGLVSLFVFLSNTERSDYDERVDIVSLNRIRRALDSGELSFDIPFASTYRELPVDSSGFEPQEKATDEQIRQFLKNTVYWLGYRYSSNVDSHFVRFDLPQDLEYLGASTDDVGRALWRLEQAGLLRKTPMPANFVPTLTLVEEFEPRSGLPTLKAEGGTQAVASEEKPAEQMQIFISHSSEDEVIAKALTELLKNALGISPEAIRCTSVDGHRLSVGTKTDEQLKRELLNARSFIALLTEESLNSTWVLFELGARWGVDRHLAPLFAAGLTPAKLRGPLPGISGLSCDSEHQIHQLVNDIAKILGVEVRKSHLYSTYVTELVKASSKKGTARRSL